MPTEQKDQLLKGQTNDTSKTKWSQFGTLVSVFFFWGFVAASNDVLIPVFKEKLHLSQVQAQMVSFAFYVAYSVGALLYFFISRNWSGVKEVPPLATTFSIPAWCKLTTSV